MGWCLFVLTGSGLEPHISMDTLNQRKPGYDSYTGCAIKGRRARRREKWRVVLEK